MKRQAGFTIVELLVVIAVIAVLMSILVPALQNARQQAKLVVCSTNLRALVHGLVEYAGDYRSKLPPSPVKFPEAGKYSRPFELNWYLNIAGARAPADYVEGYTGQFLGNYLSDVKAFNCTLAPISGRTEWPPASSGQPALGTYGLFYRTGTYAPLHATYMLLWSYQGYNHSVSTMVDKSLGHFEGARDLSSENTLVAQDALFYLTGNVNLLYPNPQMSWYSSHPFAQAGRQATPYYVYPDAGKAIFPDMSLNAGYLDGRVVRFSSAKTVHVKNSQAEAWLTRDYQ